MIRRAFLILALAGACDGAGSGTSDPDAAAEADARAPDAGACAPLDEETLSRLVISFEPHLSMQPGQTFQFRPGVIECCYSLVDVSTCPTWSVTPAGAGATVDGDGLLTIEAGAAHGSVFRVTADIEDGRELVSSDVHVYTPELNPLVGNWHEAAQLDCESGEPLPPEQTINELRFDADGTIRVTWLPFEVYYDYWGTYVQDPELGTFSLDVESGNYIPPDVDGEGSFDIDEGDLVLRDLWLGTPFDGTGPARCGHRFAR